MVRNTNGSVDKVIKKLKFFIYKSDRKSLTATKKGGVT